jgi:TonB family protein
VLRTAAAADIATAQSALAILLSAPARNEAGVREARYWGERAVHENLRSAMRSTAMIYLRERNPMPADAARARELLEKGANGGDTFAMDQLARALRDGKFGFKDGKAALRWWHKAAEANDTGAMLELATIYEKGDKAAGIYKDAAEARRLLEKAAKLKSEEAEKRLAALPAVAPNPAAKKWQPPADLLENLPHEGPPKAVYQTRPLYPFEMRRQKISGEVTVDFMVAKDGSVVNAYAIRSSRPEFAAFAVESVRQWHFRPGTKDGQPVDTHMQVPVVFTLDQKQPGSALPQIDPTPEK